MKPNQVPGKIPKWWAEIQTSIGQIFSLNPDILILDEPTNHLDLKTVLALENFLKSYTGTLILVSHDLELVHNTISKIYDLKRWPTFLRTS